MTKDEKIGIIIANLGTPDAPTPKAVRRFLKQFLSDTRVIDFPRIPWQMILRLFILPIRSPRVAKLYQKIWMTEGSPLLAYSRQQETALKAYFAATAPNVVLELAMAYGNPSLPQALEKLAEQDVDRLIILPLFPQYSSPTTGAALDAVYACLKDNKGFLPFELIHNYHDHPLYIKALAESIELEEDEHLIFSFHGIPKRYVTEGDYYPQQCQRTAQLVVEELGLSPDQWRMTYQSRFGPEEWLQPYTLETIEELPAQGYSKIALICPGFAADCLETCDEIDHLNRQAFTKAGGQSFRYIPALNASPSHIKLLIDLIEKRL